VLAVAAAGVLVARNAGKKDRVAATGEAAAAPETVVPGKALPRLVDLGAGKCIPCRMMAPILEELKKTYAGRMDVQFIDVWENPDAGTTYGIRVIPTQVFYDPSSTV
jgi:thioredoxin 1